MQHNAPIKKDVILYGAGGHSKVLIATIEAEGIYKIKGLLDDNPLKHGQINYGYSILGGGERLEYLKKSGVQQAIIAIGDNPIRKRIYLLLKESGFAFINAIHPSAVVLRGLKISEGVLIAPHAFVGADVHLGLNVVVNVGAIVGHDCRVGPFVFIGPHVTLGGSVTVQAHAYIGMGASIFPGVSVGKNAIIGANTLIRHDVPANAKVVGFSEPTLII